MNNKKKVVLRFTIVAALSALLLILAACTPTTPQQEQAPAEEEQAAPEQEQPAEKEDKGDEMMEEKVVEVLNKIFYGDTWTWPYQPDKLAHMTRGKFYVTVQDEDKIAIIDPDAPNYGLEFVQTDFVQPHHPWIAPGMRYNVINFQSEGKGDHDAMAILDTWTNQIVKYVQTGNNDPFHMAFSPTANLLVTADLDPNAGRVHLFDTESWELVKTIETNGKQTRDITISHDGKYAFIGHQGYDPDNGVMGSLEVLDLESGEIVASFGEGRCRSGKMSNNGKYVLYSCDKNDTIIVVDVEKLELVKTIELPKGSGPFNISFRPDDKFAYVGLKKAGQLGVIDMQTFELVKALDSGTDTNSTYLHPYAPIAITTNDGTDTYVSVIDTEKNEIVYTIETAGKGTHNGQWSADGRWFLVSNRLGDAVTLMRYDEETGKVEWEADIVVGFGANGVHWAPYFCGAPELTTENVNQVTNAAPINENGDCPDS